MDIDSRYTTIRNRLDTLGFCQPLPIGALGVVSAILDDLIQTTDSFKKAKYELIELKQVCDKGGFAFYFYLNIKTIEFLHKCKSVKFLFIYLFIGKSCLGFRL